MIPYEIARPARAGVMRKFDEWDRDEIEVTYLGGGLRHDDNRIKVRLGKRKESTQRKEASYRVVGRKERDG